METKFSQHVKDVLTFSKEEAERLGNKYIAPEHLLLGLLREGKGKAIDVLRAQNVDLTKVKQTIENKIRATEENNTPADSIPLLKSTDKILKIILLEIRSWGLSEADTEHLLLAILKDDKNYASELLKQENVDYNSVRKYFEREKIAPSALTRDREEDDDDDDDDLPGASSSKSTSATPASAAKAPTSKTPVLDNFGTDMTKNAEENKYDPVVGREIEIERLAQILSRRKKNNPVLIGEPGVGKSAIVEGLALRIVQRKVSRALFNKRVVTLDMASIVAGTKYRGQFEERIKAILNELSKNPNIILFIDEIHTMIGAGSAAGTLDAANMLKPALARGELQCIGATTLNEYRQSIEKDGALERRFQKIIVEPATPEETLEILKNIKGRYEEHHQVVYTSEALEACVKLTARYISDRNFPDKAIDALDEAGSRVHISNISASEKMENLESEIEKIKTEKLAAVGQQNFELAASFRDHEKQLTEQLEGEKKAWSEANKQNREVVSEEKIAEVVAMMSGIPVQRIAQAEGLKLLQMREVLDSKVIGQKEAVDKIVKAIQRNRVGLKDPNRPIGSFIFVGPTGVGKTHLAKALAEFMFDSADALIRIDMSEYLEKFSVSRLIGAPPGYVGYEEGGQLTEKVRRKPYSIVLLDEIEKAHPDVFNLLLQLLDEGRLTDSLGRKIDFKNTIIIMTSNVGTRQLKEFGKGIGFSLPSDDLSNEHAKSVIQKALNKTFAPEFLNRIDETVMFEPLSKEAIVQIIDLELAGLHKRVENLGYKLIVTEKAKKYVAEKGYEPQFGARPLKRSIQSNIEDKLSELIIRASVGEGNTIKIGFDAKKQEITSKIY